MSISLGGALVSRMVGILLPKVKRENGYWELLSLPVIPIKTPIPTVHSLIS